MKTIRFILLIGLLPVQSVFSQTILQWERCYGGTGDDEIFCAQPTYDGGYILAGLSNSIDGDIDTNHGDYDYWVIKADSIGDIEWKKTFGGGDYDKARYVYQAMDSSYLVFGSEHSVDQDVDSNRGENDAWLLKLDQLGNVIWKKTYGGTLHEGGRSVHQTSDGGYILAGWSNSNDMEITGNHGAYDAWIAKVDALGSLIWSKSYGGSGEDRARGIVVNPDGTFAFCGNTTSIDGELSGSPSHGQDDVYVVKIDQIGNVIWSKAFGTSMDDWGYFISIANNGNYLVTGYVSGNDGDVTGNHGMADIWAAEIDQAGNLVWQKCYGGTEDDKAYRIWQAQDGSYFIGAASQSNDGDVSGHHGPAGIGDFWAIIADSAHNITWQNSYGGSGWEHGNELRLTADGGFMMAGDAASSGTGDVTGGHGGNDFWLVKFAYCNSTLVPYVSITSDHDSICLGDTIIFHIVAVINGGLTPSFQWKLNNVNVGSDSPYFTITGLWSGDLVKCEVTSSLSCIASSTAESNTLSIYINPVQNLGLILLTPSTEYCVNDTVTIAAQTAPASGNILFQWYVNGILQPTITGSTYTFVPDDSDIVTCTAISDYHCLISNAATSSPVVFSVGGIFTPDVSIGQSIDSVCSGDPVLVVASEFAGGLTPGYDWYLNNTLINTSHNDSIWLASVSTNDSIFCILHSSLGCVSRTDDTSITKKFFILPLVTPSVEISTADYKICKGDTAIFIATAVDTGTAPVYDWFINNNHIGTTSSGSFATNSLENGDTVTCRLTSSAHCAAPNIAFSNSIGMKVTYQPDTIILHQHGDTLYVKSKGDFQWLLNGLPLGIHDTFLVATLPGYYQAWFSSSNNCSRISDSVFFNPYSGDDPFGSFHIWPNPVSDNQIWLVYNISQKVHVKFSITNELGQTMAVPIDEQQKADTYFYEIPIARLPAGIYFLTATIGNNFKGFKFLIVHP